MGGWTDADVQALLELVRAHGADWALIAKTLPGSRSPMSIRQKHWKLTIPKEKRDQQLLKRRRENMSAEELEQTRAAKRVANLSAEELEKRRAANRVANMSAERLEKKRMMEVEEPHACFSPERRFAEKERRERPPRRYDKMQE